MNSSPNRPSLPSSSPIADTSEQGVGGFGVARILHLLAALVALGAASYLTLQKWQGKITDLAGCGGSEGCSQLLGGRWANWMLVPVSFWAMTVYLPLLVLGFMGLKTTVRARLAWIGVGILSAGAIWFIGLQLFVEHRFCIWCFTMHSCSLILLTCIAIQTKWLLAANPSLVRTGLGAGLVAASLLVGGQVFGPQPKSHELTSGLAEGSESDAGLDPGAAEDQALADQKVPSASAPGKTASGTTGGASGVSSDTMIPPQPPTPSTTPAATTAGPAASSVPRAANSADASPTTPSGAFDALPEFNEEPAAPKTADNGPSRRNEATTSDEPGDVASFPPAAPPSAPSPAETTTDSATQPTGRELVFLKGELRFRISEVPVIGDPNAPTVVVKYFDYTCKSCRTMHDQLSAIQEQFPGQLAVVMLPCPLDRDCNPFGPPGTAHRDACQYARLGLAVWRADATKFREFHDELFHRQGRTTVAEARELAVKLVGDAALKKALEDPWIRANLRSTFAIYRRMSAQNPRMPKLVLTGVVVMHGLARDQNELTQVLQDQAGLRK